MTDKSTPTEMSAAGRNMGIAPDLLLEELEFFLASNASGPMCPVILGQAEALQRDFLASVAANISDLLGRGCTPEAAFTFLKPLLMRL